MTQGQDTGMVEAVLRAMKILDLFSMETPHLGLSAIARGSGLAKTTTLRLLRTLESCNYLVQTANAQWRLGSAAASLGGRYQMVFDVRESIEPALRELSDKTGLSTSFFVRDGKQRVRLVKVLGHDSPHGKSRVGDSMPLDRGSPGRVILAALGEPGSLYDEIRARGYHLTIGEAKQASASIAAPVFGSRWRVVGALCIGAASAPEAQKRLLADVPDLMRAASSLSAALSFASDESGRQAAMVRTDWYPS